jgi:hypothetical protein
LIARTNNIFVFIKYIRHDLRNWRRNCKWNRCSFEIFWLGNENTSFNFTKTKQSSYYLNLSNIIFVFIKYIFKMTCYCPFQPRPLWNPVSFIDQCIKYKIWIFKIILGKWWLKKYDQIYNTKYVFTTCSDFIKVYKLIHYQFIINIYSNRGQTFTIPYITNFMYSTLCKIWGKIGLPLKTIFELPYKGWSNTSSFVIGVCKSKKFDHD